MSAVGMSGTKREMTISNAAASARRAGDHRHLTFGAANPPLRRLQRTLRKSNGAKSIRPGGQDRAAQAHAQPLTSPVARRRPCRRYPRGWRRGRRHSRHAELALPRRRRTGFGGGQRGGHAPVLKRLQLHQPRCQHPLRRRRAIILHLVTARSAAVSVRQTAARQSSRRRRS